MIITFAYLIWTQTLVLGDELESTINLADAAACYASLEDAAGNTMPARYPDGWIGVPGKVGNRSGALLYGQDRVRFFPDIQPTADGFYFEFLGYSASEFMVDLDSGSDAPDARSRLVLSQFLEANMKKHTKRAIEVEKTKAGKSPEKSEGPTDVSDSPEILAMLASMGQNRVSKEISKKQPTISDSGSEKPKTTSGQQSQLFAALEICGKIRGDARLSGLARSLSRYCLHPTAPTKAAHADRGSTVPALEAEQPLFKHHLRRIFNVTWNERFGKTPPVDFCQTGLHV